MRAVRIVARAKVNLSLEVLGRRPDGFHEIRSIMQSISLSDELLIEDARHLSLECDRPELAGEDNLVLKAARALAEAAAPARGARIVLRKGIPVASGLGGASTDAAATLAGLARLWALDLPAARVAELAGSLGSDVPFFLRGGTAMVRGRGEIVESIGDVGPRWMVLLTPPHVLARKTPELYGRLDPGAWTAGDRTDRLARAIVDGDLPPALLGNAFEAVADLVFGELPRHREAMRLAGAASIHLSGSGPTIFSLFDSESDANAVAGRLRDHGYRPAAARTLTGAEAAPQPRV